jgi:hypothetical protein
MADKPPDACVNELIDRLLTASPQGAGGPPLAAIVVPVMVVGECDRLSGCQQRVSEVATAQCTGTGTSSAWQHVGFAVLPCLQAPMYVRVLMPAATPFCCPAGALLAAAALFMVYRRRRQRQRRQDEEQQGKLQGFSPFSPGATAGSSVGGLDSASEYCATYKSQGGRRRCVITCCQALWF